jgi:tripartite-type tricarboxylate transporter receptor subunit TctC
MRAIGFKLALATAVSLMLTTSFLRAQEFPTKPIRLVVPFPPGGFVDILARYTAPRMSEALGQNVLVDNRPGANGNIAIDVVAKSQPDGYTLVYAQVSNLAVNPALYKDLPFDVLKDLAPVGFVATAPQVLVVGAGSDLKTVADVIATAKAKPGELMFASSGNGSLGHLGSEAMQQHAGIKFTHVPYKGAAPAVVDVMGGRAHLFIAAMPSVIGQIRAGKLRALAVTSLTRAPELPDVPPLSEAGFPGYTTTNWLAIMGRAGTPAPVIAKLNAALNKAMSGEDIKAQFAKEGATVMTSTPEKLGQDLAADLVKWAKVVKDANVKLD